ncbi:TolC family protein [Alloalcanivorax xenomutans]|uniref:TolC family protein n=1 Tax=Alloalcanivorax xenomutans TaxID=1094342 RepID=UPI001F243AC1|nr:TolC family protein [Alloalcanivorax xenomutans]MCE7521890.1 TolC family protein [Alloalcanivorax xenomutans]
MSRIVPPRQRASALLLALLLTSLGSGTVATASPAAAPLSLEQALRLAETRSQALQAQDAAALAARHQSHAAERLPDPMLQLSLANVPVDGPSRFSLDEDPMTMRSVGLAQTFTRKAKRQARSQRFKRQAEEAETGRGVRLATMRQQTAQAWFAYYYQQRLHELLLRQRRLAAEQVEAQRSAYGSGQASLSEVLEAQTLEAEIGTRLYDASAAVDAAKARLARWVGTLETDRLAIPPALDQTRITAHLSDHKPDALPSLARISAQRRSALADADVARAEARADLTWSLMYTQRSEPFSDLASIGVSFPLQWNKKNRQQRQVAAKLAEADRLAAEHEEHLREHLMEVDVLLAQWRSNLKQLRDYEEKLIPLAAQRSASTLSAYRGNNTSLASVLKARLDELATATEKLNLEARTAELWSELEFLVPDNASLPTDNRAMAPGRE